MRFIEYGNKMLKKLYQYLAGVSSKFFTDKLTMKFFFFFFFDTKGNISLREIKPIHKRTTGKVHKRTSGHNIVWI